MTALPSPAEAIEPVAPDPFPPRSGPHPKVLGRLPPRLAVAIVVIAVICGSGVGLVRHPVYRAVVRVQVGVQNARADGASPPDQTLIRADRAGLRSVARDPSLIDHLPGARARGASLSVAADKDPSMLELRAHASSPAAAVNLADAWTARITQAINAGSASASAAFSAVVTEHQAAQDAYDMDASQASALTSELRARAAQYGANPTPTQAAALTALQRELVFTTVTEQTDSATLAALDTRMLNALAALSRYGGGVEPLGPATGAGDDRVNIWVQDTLIGLAAGIVLVTGLALVFRPVVRRRLRRAG